MELIANVMCCIVGQGDHCKVGSQGGAIQQSGLLAELHAA